MFTAEADRRFFRMSMFDEPMEQAVMQGSLERKALAPGSYRCVTECLMGTGERVTVWDFILEIK